MADIDVPARERWLDISVPVLSDAQIALMAKRVRELQPHLSQIPTVAQITVIIDRAIARLLDRNDPWRQKAERLLPLITGYDAEMIRLGLTGYLKTFRQPELRKFLAEDFANPHILDDFQPMPKGGSPRRSGRTFCSISGPATFQGFPCGA